MDVESSINPIILVFIGLIIVGSLLIPFLIDLTAEADIEPGDTWSYDPRVNIQDAEFSYSGTLLDHAEYEIIGNVIQITFRDEGTFDLFITAVTHDPYQTATQKITIEVGQYSQYHDYKPLLLLIPTMLFVAFIITAIGRKVGGGGDDDGFGEAGGFGGGDIAGKFGRGGFGGR